MAGPGTPGKAKGSPKTGGAVPGSIRKAGLLTDEERKALAIKAGGITPLEFAASVLRDPLSPMKDKQWACELLMPYMHRKLPMAVDVTSTNVITAVDVEAISNMSDGDLDKLIEAVARITQQKTV